MLDGKGRLTDIGSWYLGGAATNNIPTLSGASNERVSAFLGMVVLVVVGVFLL